MMGIMKAVSGRRFFVVFALSLLLVLGLTACGGGGFQPGPPTTETDPPPTTETDPPPTTETDPPPTTETDPPPTTETDPPPTTETDPPPTTETDPPPTTETDPPPTTETDPPPTTETDPPPTTETDPTPTTETDPPDKGTNTPTPAGEEIDWGIVTSQSGSNSHGRVTLEQTARDGKQTVELSSPGFDAEGNCSDSNIECDHVIARVTELRATKPDGSTHHDRDDGILGNYLGAHPQGLVCAGPDGYCLDNAEIDMVLFSQDDELLTLYYDARIEYGSHHPHGHHLDYLALGYWQDASDPGGEPLTFYTVSPSYTLRLGDQGSDYSGRGIRGSAAYRGIVVGTVRYEVDGSGFSPYDWDGLVSLNADFGSMNDPADTFTLDGSINSIGVYLGPGGVGTVPPAAKFIGRLGLEGIDGRLNPDNGRIEMGAGNIAILEKDSNYDVAYLDSRWDASFHGKASTFKVEGRGDTHRPPPVIAGNISINVGTLRNGKPRHHRFRGVFGTYKAEETQR